MSNIKEVLVELCAMYTSIGRNAKAAKLKPQDDSLDSKLAEESIEGAKIAERSGINKMNGYFILNTAKKVKDAFVNYFKEIITSGYNMFSGKSKKENKTTKTKNAVFTENPIKKAKELFLRFYFMVPSKYDPNREIYLDTIT